MMQSPKAVCSAIVASIGFGTCVIPRHAMAQCAPLPQWVFATQPVHPEVLPTTNTGTHETCAGYYEFDDLLVPSENVLCINGENVSYQLDGAWRDTTVSDIGPNSGISGVRFPGSMSLLGVFVGAPSGSPVPSSIDFVSLGTDFAEIHPAVNQLFFIGDGRTGFRSGARQKFWRPHGAAELRIGFAIAGSPGGTPCCLEANRCPPNGITGVAVQVQSTFTPISPAIGLVRLRTDVGVAYRGSSVGNPFTEPTFTSTIWPINWCNPPIAENFGVQWRKDGVPLADGPTPSGSFIRGATGRDLFVLDARTADAGVYDFVVTSDCESIASNGYALTVCTGAFDWQYGTSVGDLFLFLELFFSADSRADVNETGDLTSQDVFEFLAAFFGAPPC